MAAPDLRLVVLCEDTATHAFVRRWLNVAGVRHRAREVPVPGGSGGAGERHVKSRYPAEVQYYRRKANHQRVGLVVVIDADMETVQRRQQELDAELAAQGLAARETAERIAVFVPRRNIETWIRALAGDVVDETTDYKPTIRLDGGRPYPRAGEGFASFLRRAPRPGDLPSLVDARAEDGHLV